MKLTDIVAFGSVELLEELDTAVALSVSLLIKYGQWDQVVVKTLDPRDYNDPSLFYKDHLAVNLFRKIDLSFPGLPGAEERKRVALQKETEAEDRCNRYNKYLELLMFPSSADSAALTFVNAVRKRISHILGPVPSEFPWGLSNGATFDTAFADRLLPLKMSANSFGVTSSCLPLLLSCLQGTNLARGHDGLGMELHILEGNRMSVVPKTATVDRVIAIEPIGNIIVQSGIGRHIADRLSQFGYRKETLPLRHDRLARRGSLTGELCTIDLASASDSICCSLVKLLLPEHWFDLLNHARSAHTLMPDGTWRENQKFSSMGNGFTFELETLIFLAISQVACSTRATYDPSTPVSVYGDDIIAPNHLYDEIVRWLTVFGFRVNQSKSYRDSYFRESCGGNYFQGLPAPAVFIRKLRTVQGTIDKHNELFNLGLRGLRFLRRCVPVPLRVRGPVGTNTFHTDAYVAPRISRSQDPKKPSGLELYRQICQHGVNSITLPDTPVGLWCFLFGGSIHNRSISKPRVRYSPPSTILIERLL